MLLHVSDLFIPGGLGQAAETQNQSKNEMPHNFHRIIIGAEWNRLSVGCRNRAAGIPTSGILPNPVCYSNAFVSVPLLSSNRPITAMHLLVDSSYHWDGFPRSSTLVT
jgi:hypothetical protein